MLLFCAEGKRKIRILCLIIVWQKHLIKFSQHLNANKYTNIRTRFFEIDWIYFMIDFYLIYYLQLAPQCDEILLRCIWKGKVSNCTDENKMFRMQATPEGHCCMFNSKSIYDKFFFSFSFFSNKKQIYSFTHIPNEKVVLN